jgi:hypothetical protein
LLAKEEKREDDVRRRKMRYERKSNRVEGSRKGGQNRGINGSEERKKR